MNEKAAILIFFTLLFSFPSGAYAESSGIPEEKKEFFVITGLKKAADTVFSLTYLGLKKLDLAS